MLVLARSAGQSVVLDERITVTVIETSGGIVRLGISAPADVGVRRGELDRHTEAERRARSAHPAGSRRAATGRPPAPPQVCEPPAAQPPAQVPEPPAAGQAPPRVPEPPAPAQPPVELVPTPVIDRAHTLPDRASGRSEDVAEGVVDVTESRRKSSPSA